MFSLNGTLKKSGSVGRWETKQFIGMGLPHVRLTCVKSLLYVCSCLSHEFDLGSSSKTNTNKGCSHGSDKHKKTEDKHAQSGLVTITELLCLFTDIHTGETIKQDKDKDRHKKKEDALVLVLIPQV